MSRSPARPSTRAASRVLFVATLAAAAALVISPRHPALAAIGGGVATILVILVVRHLLSLEDQR